VDTSDNNNVKSYNEGVCISQKKYCQKVLVYKIEENGECEFIESFCINAIPVLHNEHIYAKVRHHLSTFTGNHYKAR